MFKTWSHCVRAVICDKFFQNRCNGRSEKLHASRQIKFRFNTDVIEKEREREKKATNAILCFVVMFLFFFSFQF